MQHRLIVVDAIVALTTMLATLGHIPTAQALDPDNWSLTGNVIAAGKFLGTTNDQALELKVKASARCARSRIR